MQRKHFLLLSQLFRLNALIFSPSRTTDQVILLHRSQVYPGFCTEGCDAFPGKLREG